MTDQEKLDAEILREIIKTESINCYRRCLQYTRMSTEQLKRIGHKSVGDALIYSVEYTEKEIKKLTNVFFRKYPD